MHGCFSLRWECKIPFELPSCNEQIKAERTRYRPYLTAGAVLKDKTEQKLVQFFNLQHPPTFTGKVNVFFKWYAKDKRKDKDNIAFAKKYILDALQKASIIKNDSWNLCTPLDVDFEIDKENAGVLIEIESVEDKENE